MSVRGRGNTYGNRISPEQRAMMDRKLSDRHHQWGLDCPAVDLDFVLCEYNHSVAVAIIDYKHWQAPPGRSNDANYETLSSLYDGNGRNLPMAVVRYWPDTWSMAARPMNGPAETWLYRGRDSLDEVWVRFSEQDYVRHLYELRKRELTRGDHRYLNRLNTTLPPAGWSWVLEAAA